MPRTPRAKVRSAYSVMTCSGIPPLTMVSLKSEWDGPSWMTGAAVPFEVPNPLIYVLDPDYPGNLCALYEDAIPLASLALVEVLRKAGVDALQTFPAELRDPLTGTVNHDYCALNILGLVACADLGRSKFLPGDDGEPPEMFDSLYIDDAKAGGLLMFRLYEASNAIVVHERVRKAVEAEIPGMSFYGPGEWSG